MKPGEVKGSIVLETEEEIDTAIGTLSSRALEVDDGTARDIILSLRD